MENKRYAIVRIDNNCPEYTEEDFECPFSNDKVECEICRQGRYGDTKEQLVSKVAQVIFIKRNSFGGKNMNKIWTETDRIYSYKLAKEIVEFLGVEE